MELVKLKSIAKVITGFPFKSNLYSSDGIRTVRGENITEGRLRWDTIKCWNEPFDKLDYYSLKADDVVIGMDGSKVGKNRARIFNADLPLLLAQRVACLRTNLEADQVYLYYCINNPRFTDYVFRIQTGSSVPHISKTQIEDFHIPFWEIGIQTKIAKVLSDLDAKIELNKKINTELEAMAKLIYDYWFVQFDFPDENGKPYKSSGGKMVYNEALKREIPEGWEVKVLGDYATIKKGKLITEKKANTDGKIKVVSAGIDFSYFHSESNYDANTITISASGASAGFINFWREPIFANDCTTIRGNNLADTLQLLGFLQMRQDYIFQQARGSAQPHVYPKDIEGLKIAIPPKEVIKQYGTLVVSGNTKISNNLKENQKLAKLRDWLLPMLMNGQVRVN